MRTHRRLALIAVLLFACGCASFRNTALNDATVAPEKRAVNQTRAGLTATDADGWFLGIAISGGGSRSANFAAACLLELQNAGILEHVDYISSVSGGSLAAAYYCSSTDDEWTPQAIEQRLTYSFRSDLMWTVFMPWNALALCLSDWDRTDILADRFASVVLSRNGKPLTFAELNPRRPRLLINSTDLANGEKFVFDNDAFDRLNADLGKYPLANAVAASAAVPGLLAPVTLRDYSTTFRQHRHVVDGGITDNAGIRTLVNTYKANRAIAGRKGLPDPYPNGAVFIILDARVRFSGRFADSSDLSFFQATGAGINMMLTQLLNNTTMGAMVESLVGSCDERTSLAELRTQMQRLDDQGYLELKDLAQKPLRLMHVSFRQLAGCSSVPTADFPSRVEEMETDLNIDREDAHRLYQAARVLMQDRFRARLEAVKADLQRGKAGTP